MPTVTSGRRCGSQRNVSRAFRPALPRARTRRKAASPRNEENGREWGFPPGGVPSIGIAGRSAKRRSDAGRLDGQTLAALRTTAG